MPFHIPHHPISIIYLTTSYGLYVTDEIIGAQLHAAFIELKSRLETTQKELDLLQRARVLDQDPRLRSYGPNASGSNSRSSNSDPIEVKEAKAAKKRMLDDAKRQARSLFGSPMVCLICGTEDNISIAHIITTGENDYSEYGIGFGYKSDLNVFSPGNFIPLCGHLGNRGTCHDAFDRYLVSIVFNPFEKRYLLICADDAPEHLKTKSNAPDYKLNLPAGWTPYHRLLAWRARYSAIVHRYNVDETILSRMNHLSEVAKSVSSVESSIHLEVDIDIEPSELKVLISPSLHATLPFLPPCHYQYTTLTIYHPIFFLHLRRFPNCKRNWGTRPTRPHILEKIWRFQHYHYENFEPSELLAGDEGVAQIEGTAVT